MSAGPKRYWFKAKDYGWGWTPCTAEGWGVVFGGIVAFTLFLVYALVFAETLAMVALFGLLAALSVGVTIWISWKKGEKPSWRWGRDKRTEGSL